MLAGGYGLAIVLSGLTDYLNPSGASSRSAQSDNDGLLATLRELVPHHADTPSGRLVPESTYVARQAPQSSLESQRWNNRPTWLATTPVTSAEPAAAQPAIAAAPALADNRPPEPAPLAPADPGELMPRPVARITNVVGTSNGSLTSSPSLGDRWPRWDSGAAQSPGGIVATSFQPMPMEPVKSRTSRGVSDDAEFRPEIQPRDAETDDYAFRGRTHVVIDGDSLSRLADRYLDDPTLEDDIFRLNRDVLTDPAMLPIGVELRIPDRRMADSAALSPVTRTIEAAQPNLSAGMVPVERVQRSFDEGPRARLMGPIAASRSD
jgi:nucleoid-associated protein YgaU